MALNLYPVNQNQNQNQISFSETVEALSCCSREVRQFLAQCGSTYGCLADPSMRHPSILLGR